MGSNYVRRQKFCLLCLNRIQHLRYQTSDITITNNKRFFEVVSCICYSQHLIYFIYFALTNTLPNTTHIIAECV